MEKKTPLYEVHLAAHGKIVPFAGYLLPVEYGGLMKEHEAVRTACGIFDVSHMGEVLVKGPGALATLERLLTNRFADMPHGKCRYSAMCYENGGMVDDLIVYRIDDETFYIVVNAANKDKDVAWMRKHLLEGTVLEDLSDRIAQIALQGPKAAEILAEVSPAESLPEGYYTFTKQTQVADRPCLVSRTGYTGEDGYEIYCAPEDAPHIWRSLLERGADRGLVPCGLGARDTLRLEAAMPLYGHEMNADVSPLEAGLAFGVKMDKDDFIGKQALSELDPLPQCRIGLQITGRGIAREHAPVYIGDRLVGETTSGTYCPHLKGAYAMALVKTGVLSLGDEVDVDVRGRRVSACVVPLPFYRRS